MLKAAKAYFDDFAHLFFPHTCVNCGSDSVESGQLLCIKCLHDLPQTGFFSIPENPIDKIFYGRIKVEAAASGFYFTKNSAIQKLLVELKYKGNKQAGKYLGKITAGLINKTNRFTTIDAIVPLPLNARKEKKRGYNQAQLIADEIGLQLRKPVLKNAVKRTMFTETQTQKGRISRWQNMQNVFSVTNASVLESKHILLIDDVVTTGATLEACGLAILKVPNTKLSIATVACTI